MSELRRYVVLNSKGGCGKTTLASNLAGYFASNGIGTALFDYDPQCSASHWLSLRAASQPRIHGVAVGQKNSAPVTRSFLMRLPQETRRVILDTPASMKRMELTELLRSASAVLVPVLPSAIDAHATANFIEELSTVMRTCAPHLPIGLVANRVRSNTPGILPPLERLSEKLDIPLVACLRETPNYLRAADAGISVHEMDSRTVRIDRAQWRPLVDWLEGPAQTQLDLEPRAQRG